MFSNNGEISKRQIKRMLLFDLLGITTIMLPGLLADMCGRDGIFAIIAGTLLQIGYLCLVEKIAGNRGNSIVSALERKKKKALLNGIRFFYLLVFVAVAGYVTTLTAGMIQSVLLKEESFYLLLVCLLVLAGYGISQGLEGRARIYEVLYFFLLVPLFLMLLFACKDVRTQYWCPVFYSDLWNFVKGTLTVYGFLHLSSLIFLLEDQSNKNRIPQARRAVAYTGVINGILYMILVGVFQYRLVAQQDYGVIVLMSMIRLPGGFLKRQDAVMMAVWFFSLYALLNSCTYQGGQLLKGMCDCKGTKRYTIPILVVVFFVAVFYHHNSQWVKEACSYVMPVVVGISSILIPFCLAGKEGRGNEKNSK